MLVSVPTVPAAPRLTSGAYLGGWLHDFFLTADRESNAHAFALTPHPCSENKYHVCETSTCGGTYSEDRFAGKCDANGCDYNPYRMGNKDFYGKGMTVDTSKKFT
jgi:hypothetical protein